MNGTGTGPKGKEHCELDEVRLFLCGDVMTGRGIDQILPHPCRPELYESYVRDARDYVKLAIHTNGRIRKPVSFDYIWRDALPVLQQFAPDIRIINLETSITTSIDYWRGKGINYRMHPQNVSCLYAAGIDCCALANNHVLDWGYLGLSETLKTLSNSGIQAAGAGADLTEARQPVIQDVAADTRVLLFSFGCHSSGIPLDWAASADKPGVWLVAEQSLDWIDTFARRLEQLRRVGDIVVCSIHWGRNWGYDIPDYRRQMAYRLIDEAGVDIVYGHSSHHALGIERYRDRLILYGCGDCINDYEGIGSHTEYRGDLPLLYLIRVKRGSGTLIELMMAPMQIRQMCLNKPSSDDIAWLEHTLDRESRKLGCRISRTKDDQLKLL